MAQKHKLLSSLSAFLGILLLGSSFGINPGPPAHVTVAQLAEFGVQHANGILWGGWLQLVGSLLLIAFAIAMVVAANSVNRFLGMMTILGGTLLMVVNVIEVTGYIFTLYGSPSNIGLIALDFIHAIQHMYFILGAPALFIPLGFLVLRTHILQPVFGYIALGLGVFFAIAGMYTLTNLVVPSPLLIMASVQMIWWLAAAIAFMIRPEKLSEGSIAGYQHNF